MRPRTFSEGIRTGSVSKYTKSWHGVSIVVKKRKKKKYSETVAVRSLATKVVKHLASKEGLKLSAKVTAKAIMKLSKLFASPWMAPIIWAPEIIDIATSEEVKRMWNNFKSEEWWKEAKKRDEAVRKEVKERGYSEVNILEPLGNYYHKDRGWYS